VSGSAGSRADVLLGGRLGQAMLADLAGLDPLVLLAAAGKPPPAGRDLPGVVFAGRSQRAAAVATSPASRSP
jgi:hypothetical protein